jgi:hypothetical protein
LALTIRYAPTVGYFAVVTPLPSLDVSWANDAPLKADELIRELQLLGFHQQDIGDAFLEADPDWLQPDR